ncbi:uncharacterized protein LOC115450768 [Manduca sexta]|uniref:Trissin n=1 Tax=Manduca sexta TaxID=7130 RepID=A0A921ZNT0_MANSE|nr:uncharacterized protein LOC115450768 [Manduca sexta]KAG6461190.1 hypothetical protein O3G_MSEX012478 [Manduca sexta]KAG6461191.1 hypothetical protein O3G_MSEX012478 [Manduca sexta]
MFKLSFIVSIMILGTLICAHYHNVNCNSCGDECKRACGTRQFKVCCYNYLRKKRVPDTVMVVSPVASIRSTKLPFFMDNMPQDAVEAVDQYKYYPNDDSFDMRLINDF